MRDKAQLVDSLGDDGKTAILHEADAGSGQQVAGGQEIFQTPGQFVVPIRAHGPQEFLAAIIQKVSIFSSIYVPVLELGLIYLVKLKFSGRLLATMSSFLRITISKFSIRSRQMSNIMWPETEAS
jgi:hypothetical protein